MSWHKTTFNAAQLAGDIESKLVEDFMESFLISEHNKGMALFCGEESESKTYYLSKESRNFETHFKVNYHGEACEKPDLDNISLVAGTLSNT